ncbi:hypothetical protein MBLNU457_2205t2 [Dothideomycetes sp. NU457]
MLETFDFRPWPVCTNNIVWSTDNIVAVAVTGSIELLVPRYTRAGSTDRWTVLSIDASSFTHDEFPLLDPAPWSAFDVGEELSDRFVTSHSWSPPGLGKHGFCVLAVLTSNHVLSLWGFSGRPDSSEDWHRITIVNKVLNGVYDDRRRIHSFAWLPVPFSPAEQEGPGGRTSNRSHHLAVCDDLGNIHLIKVGSRDDLAESKTLYQMEVVVSISVSPVDSMAHPLLAALPSSNDVRSAVVDQIACSLWDVGLDDTLCATLAFTCMDRLFSLRLRLVKSQNGSNIEAESPTLVSIPDTPIQISGPLLWSPRLSSLGNLLIFFSTASIYCMSISPRTGVHLSSRKLDTTWKRISGLYFTINELENPMITFAIHYNKALPEQVVFPLPLQNDTSRQNPKWYADVHSTQTMHDSRDENRAHTYVRLYGLARSPLNDQSAVCISTHPDDAVEYFILAAQATTLIISREEDNPGKHISACSPSILPCEVGAAAMYPLIRRVVENAEDGPFDASALSQDMLRLAGLSASVNVDTTDNTYIGLTDEQAASLFRRRTFYDRESALSRHRRLIQLAKDGSDKVIKPNLAIVRRLVSEALAAAIEIDDEDELSKHILQSYRIVEKKIVSREGHGVDEGLDVDPIEACKICQAIIPFEALRWARCPNGHQSKRCGLTFLAIQSPAATRQCGICNTPYLNEHMIGRRNQTLDDTDHESMSRKNDSVARAFARTVFAACDACIYCGGKFVG